MVERGATGERTAHRQRDDGASAKGPRRFTSGFATLRDAVLFGLGVVIIAYQVFFTKAVDPTVIGVGVALTGLPLVFGADERKSNK